MKPSEIISSDAVRNHVDPNRVLEFAADAVQNHNAVLLHANNSVLLVVPLGNSSAMLHLYTADSPLTLMKSVSSFIEDIRKTHLHRVYGKADNPEILSMLQRLGVDVQHSDRPEFNWMANV